MPNIICVSCGEPVIREARAVVFLSVAWHRKCWTAELDIPPSVTPLQRRAGRNWGTGRCRMTA